MDFFVFEANNQSLCLDRTYLSIAGLVNYTPSLPISYFYVVEPSV